MSKTFNFLNGMKRVAEVLTSKYVVLPVMGALFSTGLFAQQHFGDLELTVLGNGNQPALGVPVKAIDPALEDTTTQWTDGNSQAYFEDLYIYTIDDIKEQKKKEKFQFLKVL